MAFLYKAASTIRTHWKKSTLGLIVTAYGVKYVRNRIDENNLIRAYCAEARRYGEKTIGLDEAPKKMTIFLNPASKSGKGRKLFERYAEPILSLAGVEINIVSTEYEGQVKEFLKVLGAKDTDFLVVAGGGGTLLETVTGIMRKDDDSLRKKVPVGVVPLGKKNYFAQLLYGDADQGRLIAKAAITIVRGVTKAFDVMKIEGQEGKVTYALCGLETGVFRDAEERMPKYWYLGPLKTKWPYLRMALGEWPPQLHTELSYVEGTEDTLRLQCLPTSTPTKPPRRSWMSFLYQSPPPQQEEMEEFFDDSQDTETSKSVTTTELSLVSSNFSSQQLQALQLCIGPPAPSRTDLIKEGWQRNPSEFGKLNSEFFDEKLVAKKVKLVPVVGEEDTLWFNIDGEAFEAMPVEVSILKKRLKFFCEAQTDSNAPVS